MGIIMSLVGMAFLIGMAILLSDNRKAIRLRTVLGAFAVQLFFGAFVLYVPWGKRALLATADAVSKVIDYGNDGIGFMFGDLVSDSGGMGFIFALRVLPVIIFFSALISVLYYLGIMQWVINLLGGGLRMLLGTSRAEVPFGYCEHFCRPNRSAARGKALHFTHDLVRAFCGHGWWTCICCWFGPCRVCFDGRPVGIFDRGLVHGCPGGLVVR